MSKVLAALLLAAGACSAHAKLITGGVNSKSNCDWWHGIGAAIGQARDGNTPEPELISHLMKSDLPVNAKTAVVNIIALVYSDGDFTDLNPEQIGSEIEGECIASKVKW